MSTTYILTSENLMWSILFTLVMSGFVFVCYRLCHDTLTYNKKFNITLIMLSLVSTVLLALIRNNPLLSLGVLGSLSICRIRTNTRDPRGLGFVFWSLMIGISSCFGAFWICAGSSLILGTLLVIFHKFDGAPSHQMLVIRGNKSQLAMVQEIFHEMGKGEVQSKNVFADTFELVYEIQLAKKEDFDHIKKVLDQKGVTQIKGIFLSHGHKDHAGNLKRLLEQYKVEVVYVSAIDQASYGKIHVDDIVNEKDTTLIFLKGGEELNLEGVLAKVWIPKTCDF